MKYRINIKPILAFILALVLFSGCDEWMDLEPENALTQDEFWKTKEDVMAALGATYDSNRGNSGNSFLWGEVRADFIGTSLYPFSELANNEISKTSEAARWGNFYSTINLANTVMHFAPLVSEDDKTLTPEILDEIEAEMTFLRSLSYFYLVRIWKDVPYVPTATISDTVDFYIPKSDETVVLKRVENDLKSVIDLASTDPMQKGRANKYAIQALLADVLLWGEKYQECISYCDAIINSGMFGLESSTNWFNLYYPGNARNESIFEIQYNDQLEAQGNSIYNYLGDIFIYKSYYGYDIQNDIRYCKSKGPAWKFWGTNASGSGAYRRSPGEYDVNFIYYRYAEVLLMKAEALAEIGNFEEANGLVRQIAERAGVTHAFTYDLEAFKTALLAERGRELSAEGKRWFDVLRFAKKDNFKNQDLVIDILLGKAENAQELAIMRTKVLDTMSYYLPIHEDEIKVNKNLVQNPFYDR